MHCEELDSHKMRITETGTRISALEDVMDSVEGKLRALEKQVLDLSERTDDLGEQRKKKKHLHRRIPRGG